MDWSNCPLITSDPDVVHGEPVFVGTRVPAGTVVENVEAYLDEGLSLEQAMAATLDSFPGVPQGLEGIRALLTYCASQEPQLAL